MNDEIDMSKVTRLEVIDHSGRNEWFGRVYTNYKVDGKAELAFQDGWRTLKVFIW